MTTINTLYGLPQTCQRRGGCDAAECFYCGNPLSMRHEHDHFPVPARAGGNHVVPACYNCHDLKDRVQVGDWPVSATFMAVLDLMAALNVNADEMPEEVLSDREETFVYLLREVVDNLGLHTTSAWQQLSTPGRLLFAKLCHRLTGDHPVDTDEHRERRAEVMAPWVDADHARYSHLGPTTRHGGVIA
ncbi:hypothetical protein A5761_03060 [Mycolicibacterium setense]|uniref:hypothetical protein n=1 Tax=Mycolicibacterium setense TaxID=431269 RepID=UPI0007EB47FF|nr:hypothetical protein [Mycolicibacterium setense]OBB21103.1 hypothetical protein A5761_03060 [Mycolicibacterium setense]